MIHHAIGVYILLAAPLMAAGVSFFVGNLRLLHGVNLTTTTALVFGDLVLWSSFGGHESFTVIGGLVFVDALSLMILSVITVIGLACALYMKTYFDFQSVRDAIPLRRMNRFFALFQLFLFAMIGATLANNLGIQWVALEATTLATVFLITVFRKPESLEAGWKYLILCSVGIALALFGVVLTYYSSIRVLGEENAALSLTSLLPVADYMDPEVLKLAFIFILIGYGTKIGLVPMHTWVPEAYSEAPAPVTAMLAGVLETVAVYTVLRSKSIVDQALPPEYTGHLLIIMGMVSLGTAAMFMLIQRDYKRMLAYSSIEHMGIAIVGFGVGGPTGVFGGLYHLLSHAFAKSLGFFAAGNIFHRYGSRHINQVQGIAKALPITAIVFLISGLALVGMPPLAMFNSAILVFSSLASMTFRSDSFRLGEYVTITISNEVQSLGIVALILLFAVVVFGGFMYRLSLMVWGEPSPEVQQGEVWSVGHVPMVLMACALIWMGIGLPDFIATLLQQATNVVLRR